MSALSDMAKLDPQSAQMPAQGQGEQMGDTGGEGLQIDRIEDGVAVLYDANGQQYEVDPTSLPEGAAAGDTIELDGTLTKGDASGDMAKRGNMLKSDPGGDIKL
jgi:hypothetical protein